MSSSFEQILSWDSDPDLLSNTPIRTTNINNSNTNNTRQPRRQATCSLCRNRGHNIRCCPLHETTRKEGIRLYSQFVYHAITGFSNKWDYTGIAPDIEENSYYNVPSEEMMEIFRRHQDDEDGGLMAILSTQLQWLRNLSDVMIKGLKYGYTINVSSVSK